MFVREATVTKEDLSSEGEGEFTDCCEAALVESGLDLLFRAEGDPEGFSGPEDVRERAEEEELERDLEPDRERGGVPSEYLRRSCSSSFKANSVRLHSFENTFFMRLCFSWSST